MNVQQRLDAARAEAESIQVNLRAYSGHFNSEDREAMRGRHSRLARQIAMLTEDQREPQPIPEPVRRPYR